VDRHIRFAVLILVLVALIFTGCAPGEEQSAESTTLDIIDPTATTPPTAEPTETPKPPETPTPTPLPGEQVIPLEDFQEGIPWLPFDESRVPMTYFVIFNKEIPPFDNPLVCQAFIAAIDKSEIIEYSKKYNAPLVIDPQPATNFIPPEVLGRDLFGEVGIPFNPERALELFAQAGYSDGNEFPEVTLVVNVSNDLAKGIHLAAGKKMAEMWFDTLGVEVTVDIELWENFRDRITENPPEMIRVGWTADYQDPQNFMNDLFGLDSGRNYGGYSDPDFYDLIGQASEISDPLQRQLLYIEADRIISETNPAVIPIFHAFYDKR